MDKVLKIPAYWFGYSNEGREFQVLTITISQNLSSQNPQLSRRALVAQYHNSVSLQKSRSSPY